MSLTAAPVHPGSDRPAARRAGFAEPYQRLVEAAVWIMVATSAISFIEPSPYDYASFIALPLWAFGGFRVHRSFVLPYFLLVGYTVSGFLALVPYWTKPDSTIFEYQSMYLVVTALFYALFIAERTPRRAELLLTAYAVGAFVAAAAAIVGYFDIAGLGSKFSAYGRGSGTFKEPNVLGSYIILGELYLMQNLLLGRARFPALSLIPLIVMVAGIFLSFSRGSWGATIFSTLLMIGSAFKTTSSPRMRARIATITLVAAALAVIVVLALLSNSATRDFFLQRAAVEQYYDTGETGRFGNQLRSLPLLLERFFGFGPLRFRDYFGLDPHNSYVGAFADNGWIGGLINILMVGVTSFVGLRLMWRASPYQRLAQVFVPALIVFYLQAFQIDIDHWRHVYIMFGTVWGLEAARQKWVASRSGMPERGRGEVAGEHDENEYV